MRVQVRFGRLPFSCGVGRQQLVAEPDPQRAPAGHRDDGWHQPDGLGPREPVTPAHVVAVDPLDLAEPGNERRAAPRPDGQVASRRSDVDEARILEGGRAAGPLIRASSRGDRQGADQQWRKDQTPHGRSLMYPERQRFTRGSNHLERWTRHHIAGATLSVARRGRKGAGRIPRLAWRRRASKPAATKRNRDTN